MGVALAEFQNSGEQLAASQWNEWQHKKIAGSSPIKEGAVSGSSCDHWHRIHEDTRLIQELGCNSCRFSLDWSAIEPTQGSYSQEAIDHYHQELDALREAGITPMATLHHFVHPLWFEKKGGFERLENLHHFVSFCKKVFIEYRSKISLWCTINEPAPYAFQGYISGVFPPGKHSLKTAATVLRNMLVAHQLVYKALKSLDGGSNASIGLVHQYITFEQKSAAHLLEWLPCWFLNYFFNELMLTYLKTGNFSFDMLPFFPVLSRVTADEVNAFFPELSFSAGYLGDFIGLNYYSRVVIEHKSWNFLTAEFIAPSCKDGEIMTDMPYPLYAKGLYEAIKDMTSLKKPIYITENGISDKDDSRRERFFKEYLSELSRALSDGFDVRGWYYWTLMDNFEWDQGFTQKFGLYEVNFQTQERQLRPAGHWFKQLLSSRKIAPPASS